MKESVFSLAEAKFTTGDFNHLVLQNVSKAQLKVRSKRDNVAGKLFLSFFTVPMVGWLKEMTLHH